MDTAIIPENLDLSTAADIFIIIVVLISAGVAFFRGLIREVLTIAGVIGGLAAAVLFGGSLIPMMEGFLGVGESEEAKKLFDIIPYEYIAIALAYGAVFLGVIIGLSILSHFLTKAAASIGLGPIDRTLGIAFGIARAVLLLGVLYLPVHLMFSDKDKEAWFGNSNLIVYVEMTSDWLAGYLPDTTDQTAEERMESMPKILKDLDILKSQTPSDGTEEETGDDASSTIIISPEYEERAREELETLIETMDEEEAIEIEIPENENLNQ